MKRLFAMIVGVALLLCGCVGDGNGTSTTTTVMSTSTTTTDTISTANTTTDGITTVTDAPSSSGYPTDPTGSTAIVTRTTTTIATTTKTTAVSTTTTAPKPTAAEFRGAWVSYLELNALLEPCTTAEQGKAAIDGLLDQMAAAKMTAVFFHVRANSDAYYPSAIFKTASAAQVVVEAGFDPLAYAVEAAHKRGMELHAWVNPYRVGFDASYIVEGMATFQDNAKRYYYIPTDTDAQKLILDGIRELLTYDIDGVQYDDYFYPSGLLEETAVYSFESADYEAYTTGGGKLSVGDWRRAGVDALVAGTHALTRANGVVFGVSPAHDASKTYNQMFADSKKWLAESGYVDYLCPQLYFGFDHSTAAFDDLTDTWLSYDRDPSVQLYVGLGMHKIGLKSDPWAGNGKTEWAENDDVLKRQVEYLRKKGISGIGFYSSSLFDPATCTVVNFTTDNDLSVAKKEIANLLSIL